MGRTFLTLTQEDGLASNGVRAIVQDQAGAVWFGTNGGVTRYRPPAPSTPSVVLDAVVTDRRYAGVSELTLPSTVGLIVFEFHGLSLKTRPDGMVYRYRLVGYDQAWKATRTRRVEYHDLPRGTYTFEVQAVDRDLGYSATPATVALTVHLPYAWIGVLSALGLAIIAGAVATGYAVQRRRERDRAQQQLLATQAHLVDAMGKELQTAHDMQMSLLPQSAPLIPGFEIAGRCLPANHVGGDHFTYRWLDDTHTKLAIVVADVSGKEMKAAMTVMRFAEVLHYELQGQHSPAAILTRLNRAVWGRLEPRLYVTACVGVLDVAAHRLTVALAGHPPVYQRVGATGQVREVGRYGLPLGVEPEVAYGDVLVFYTDGVYEARDGVGRLYGFERLRGAIGGMEGAASVAGIVDRMLAAVEGFIGGAAQHEDDMTLVVVKVTG